VTKKLGRQDRRHQRAGQKELGWATAEAVSSKRVAYVFITGRRQKHPRRGPLKGNRRETFFLEFRETIKPGWLNP